MTLGKGLALVANILVARSFPRTELAQYFLLIGLGGFGGTLVLLGLDQRVYRKAATAVGTDWGYAPEQVGELVALALRTAVLLSLPFAVYALLFSDLGDLPTPLGLLCGAVVVLGGALRRIGRSLAVAGDQADVASMMDTVAFFACVTCIASLSLLPGLPANAVGTVVAAGLVSGVLVILYIRRNHPQGLAWRLRGRPRVDPALKEYRESLPNFIIQLAGEFLNRGDVLLLGLVGTADDLVNYGLAIRVTYFVSVVNELSTLLFGGRLVRAARCPSNSGNRRLIIHCLTTSLAMAAIVSGAILVDSESFLRIVFGEAFVGPSRVVLLLVLGKTMTAIANPLNVYLTAVGLHRESSRGYIWGVALVLSSVLLASGTTGALLAMAYGVFAALLVIAANNLFLVWRSVVAGR